MKRTKRTGIKPVDMRNRAADELRFQRSAAEGRAAIPVKFTAVGVTRKTKQEIVSWVNDMTNDPDYSVDLTVADVTDDEAQAFVNRFEAMAIDLLGVAGEEGALESIGDLCRTWRAGLGRRPN